MLKKLRKFLPLLPNEAREMVTRALILSRLDYSNALYIGLPAYLMMKLQVVQNAAARTLLGRPGRSSAYKCQRELHWLPVRHRVVFKALTLAHGALYKTGPLYLRKRFTFYVPSRDLRSAGKGFVAVPRYRLSRVGGSSLSVKAAVAWNSLPRDLCTIGDIRLFKKQLKTWLFSS